MADKKLKLTKGNIFSIVLVFNDTFLKAMQRSPEILQAGMMKAAQFWHARKLPKHFVRGAGTKYDYGERTWKYIKRKKGRPHLVFTGSLERQIKSNARFKADRSGVATRMHARSLNFVPNTADSSAKQIKLSDGRMYPNIKREIKVVIVDERVEMANIVENHVRREFKKAQK